MNARGFFWRRCWAMHAIALAALFCGWPTDGAAAAEPAAEHVKFFEIKVRPLLVSRCFECHGGDEQEGEFKLDSRAGLLAGGESGEPAIVPGKPEESLLVEAINFQSLEMPPDEKLSEAEIETLTTWIKLGAPWPGGDSAVIAKPQRSKITDEDRAWWAYQPVIDHAPPAIESEWIRNDVDRFILAKLQGEKLSPAAEAQRRQLVRRVYFDLIGLPPTTDEIEAFVSDTSPTAYEDLVDRLLASPHYGERWARHWLDLVRYAEGDGYKADGYRDQAWKYRDYVIKSLNDDKPYGRFVIEQLAGDEIAPQDPDARTATMFLRHGMYEYNQRDVVGQWQHILNEITDTVGDVFLGVGMGCARCHDHKFDPILQKDYYRLQAFFTPLDWREDAPLASVDELRAYREKLAEYEAATVDVRRAIDAIERPILLRTAGGEGFAKFTPELQAMIAKPAYDRTPYEQQIAELALRQMPLDRKKFETQLDDKLKAQLGELAQQLAKFDGQKPQPPATCSFAVSDVGPAAPPTFIPGKERLGEIGPGFLSVLDERDAEIAPLDPALASTGRRTALARWIASPDNPLSTRVIVNRVWQYHFGTGLAANSSDFGRLGDPPSHPELLDWLTRRFVDGGWRLKPLHRLIVTSATYRQSALVQSDSAMLKDPGNRLLWRQNIRRLDAEQIRDAMLAAAGQLDRTAGGPSVGHAAPRRTIYTKVMRNTQDPLLAVFDAPDALASSASRPTTTTAPQALFMINGAWTLERAAALAHEIKQTNPASASETVERAWSAVYGRAPAASEMDEAVAFLTAIDVEERSVVVVEEDKKKEETHRRDAYATKPLMKEMGDAAMFRPRSEQEKLHVPFDVSLPAGDFTVEAYVQLDSIFEDASVRTIVAHWNAVNEDPGWSLGVTSKKSAHQPRNLILQFSGINLSNQPQYEVVPSGIYLELGKPYFVAASVKIDDTSESGITFYVKELFGHGKLHTAQARHNVVLDFRPQHALTIGGRAIAGKHTWDGLIDNVRLSNKALAAEELAINSPALEPRADTAGLWRFESQPGFYADSSPNKNDLRPGEPHAAASSAPQANRLVDLCHVLLNSSEFLYVD